MSSWLVVGLPLLCFVLALALTAPVRRFTLRNAVIDHPGERSSHEVPTPRGGGLAIVLACVAGLLVVALTSVGSPRPALALAGIAALAAALGWLDDRHDLGAGTRLAVQFLLAGMAVWLLGAVEAIAIGGWTLHTGWLAWPFTLAWLVWLANLYNFMDGIDGIASVETTLVCATLALWFAVAGEAELALASLVLAAAAAGFLVWNWSPARLFMGDVGSVTLGLLIGMLTVAGMNRIGLPWDAAAILLGVFLGDATVTLLARLARGERVWEAHRSHFYQRAVRTGATHAAVSLTVLAVDLGLAVLASLAAARVAPQGLWPASAIILLAAAGGWVALRERRQAAA